jgi:hypothetical protein
MQNEAKKSTHAPGRAFAKYFASRDGLVSQSELLLIDVELARLDGLAERGALSRIDLASLRAVQRRLRVGLSHNDAFAWLAANAAEVTP